MGRTPPLYAESQFGGGAVTTAIGVGVIMLTESAPECYGEEKMLYMPCSFLFSFSDSCQKKNPLFYFFFSHAFCHGGKRNKPPEDISQERRLIGR